MFTTSLLSAAIFAILSVSSAFAYPLASLLPVASDETQVPVETKQELEAADVRIVTVTAYSSSKDETDSTPYTTASNTRARDGVVAANTLPFGTRVRVPSLFGDREFTVEDRMHRRHQDRIDIWFPSKQKALRFGIVHGVLVEVLR